ncbi:MAG: hypothetical protein US89_C0005G0024 [Candidatus Peregrinibacteria bacterium GW2011_GWF2_38_29]|nr:MAG: hypothetical protein US89_C0005G0024 [Candidatus Peregrinibacteria bacterium GW2011_GWF2_38_29]HBB02613.1 hypothetical protein [Candidatus Peregrinibacteria bacterium]
MEKISPKDKIIHDQFSAYGKNAKEWMNKCVLLLPKIEKNQIWQKKGFESIYEYAAKIAGMSRNKVNEGLRILKKTENLPEIQKVIEIKGVFAVKPIANIATKDTDQFWAKRASEMTKSTLETFVKDYKKEQILDRPGAGSPINLGSYKPNIFEKEKIQISMKLSPEIVDMLKKIKGDGDWNRVMKKLLKYSQSGIEAEQKILEIKEKQLHEELKKEKPEAVKANAHTVTTAIENYIIKRSGGICEHPNCNKPAKHIHHLEPFALKKKHDPDKLVHLCTEHHQIIHLGYIDDGCIVPKMATNSTNQKISLWQRVQKLPSYDIKNAINKKIFDFRRNYNSQQLIT